MAVFWEYSASSGGYGPARDGALQRIDEELTCQVRFLLDRGHARRILTVTNTSSFCRGRSRCGVAAGAVPHPGRAGRLGTVLATIDCVAGHPHRAMAAGRTEEVLCGPLPAADKQSDDVYFADVFFGTMTAGTTTAAMLRRFLAASRNCHLAEIGFASGAASCGQSRSITPKDGMIRWQISAARAGDDRFGRVGRTSCRRRVPPGPAGKNAG